MPTINIAPKAMQNGDNITAYKDTVGTQQQTYTFLTAQERVILKNSGSKNITYTVGSQSGTLGPSQIVDVKETISSINLTAAQGTQQFEIWADEAGSIGGGNIDLTPVTTSIATKAIKPTNEETATNGQVLTANGDGTSTYKTGGAGGSYTLPQANASTLGGVKIGSGVTVSADGTISVSGGAGGTSSAIQLYKTEPLGELFDQPSGRRYLAWPATALKYDSTLKKYVCIVNACDKHVFTTLSQFICYIDPTNYSKPTLTPITVTGLTLDQKAICNFTIMPDGSYMMIALAGNLNHKVVSSDRGATWTDAGTITGNTAIHFWGIYRLSSGRLIGSIDGVNNGFYWSDNGGLAWSAAKPTGTPGNYNAEACIIEVKTGQLMAIARKNMGGTGGDATYGSGPSNHAIISFSTDNGTTWTPWAESNTIDDMNGSCCTAIVHDGIVELFVGSRWYHNVSAGVANTNYTNTGKAGAITHYHATLDNALADSFTNDGVVVYANGVGDNDPSQDFHSPCVATDGSGNMLLVYFDRTYPYTIDNTNYNFVRGTLNDLRYKTLDNSQSILFGYSSSKLEKLLTNRDTQIATLQNAISKLSGTSILSAPTGIEMATYNWGFNSKKALMDSNSPFYNNIYTSNTLTNGNFSYATATNSSDATKTVFKQNRNTMLAYPTKANFMVEIKVKYATGTKIGTGIVFYDGSKYYGLYNIQALNWSNGGANGGNFFMAADLFNGAFHTIKLKKQNGVYTLTIDGYDYNCIPLTALDGNSMLERYATTSYYHYLPASNTIDTAATFTAIPQQPVVMLETYFGFSTNYAEYDYINYGEWDS